MRELSFCLLAFSLLAASGCQEQTPRVKTEKATFLTLPGQLEAYGITIARDPYIVTAKSQGDIHHLGAKVGDVVTEGQVLAKLRQPTLELRRLALAANLGKARANEEAVFGHLKALEAQSQQGILPEYRLIDAQVKASIARTQTLRAEESLRQLEHRINQGIFRAPFGALVTGCYVREGESVVSPEPLFSLALGGLFSIKIYPHEPLEIGSLAEVSVASASLRGEVGAIATASWPLGVARIDLTETPLLEEGWPAKVKIRLGPRKMLAVPDTALRDGGVFLREGHTARWIAVETGSRESGYIEIRAGLLPGAEVITWSSAPLVDGGEISP